MKRLDVKCRLSEHELINAKTYDFERIIKERLARDLAYKLVENIKWTERNDYPRMEKEITAEVYITDKETVDKYDALKYALKLIKESV